MTFRPARKWAGTSLPASTMVAAISWPGMRGYETSGFLPRNVLKSVPTEADYPRLQQNLAVTRHGPCDIADRALSGGLYNKCLHGCEFTESASGLR